MSAANCCLGQRPDEEVRQLYAVNRWLNALKLRAQARIEDLVLL